MPRFATVVFLLLAAAGCADRSPTGAAAHLSGAYALVSVDGQPLPIDSPPQTDGASAALVSGAMTFADPDTVRVTETTVTVQAGRPTVESTALGIYRYTRAGAALTLLPVIATYRMEGTVSGGVITLQEPHGDGSFTTLVFKR